MNERFTVIIPEHNRPEHLKRLLDYFLSQNVKIIVADSSINEFKYVKDYSGKITYKHFPGMALALKINLMTSLIETPFVVMCANDDFIVPDAINEIIDFLEINPEYNSGQGIFFSFDPFEERLRPVIRYSNMINGSIEEDLPSERIKYLLKNYFQFYYAVHRTSVFKNVYNSVIYEDKTLIDNLCLLEVYTAAYTILNGKHKIINRFYGARENIVNSAGVITDSMYEVLTNKKYQFQIESFDLLLLKCLCENQNIGEKESKIVIEDSINFYMDKHFPHFNSKSKLFKIFLKEKISKMDIFKVRKIFKKKSDYSYVRHFIGDFRGIEKWELIKKYIIDYKNIYN